MAPTLHDISTREDLTQIITDFYDRLLADPVLKDKFVGIHALEPHLSVIVDFWQSMLIGGASYGGQPFDVHVPLALEEHHFDGWLRHLRAAIAAHCAGEKSDSMIQRAEQIAELFKFKLGIPRSY